MTKRFSIPLLTVLAPLAPLALLALLVPPVLAQAQGVDADAMRRCRALADMATRLGCYDALPLPAAGAAAAAASTTPAPAATATATATAPAGGAALFGLDQRRPGEVDAVSSSLIGPFQGWGPNTRFTLANGQVWRVSDDSSGYYNLQDPKVTVRRGAFGSYMLDVEGANKMPRVKRVQ